MNEINNPHKLSMPDRINRVFNLASQEKDLLWTIQRVIKKHSTNPEYALITAKSALDQANACKFNITTWEEFLKEYPV
jgi:predicted transcriptional regulator